MLIRLQDGHGLINMDDITEISVTDYGSVMARVDKSGVQITLASYETIEGALKVLDMIEDAYKSEGVRDTWPENTAERIAVFALPKKVVFQMPQDDEVEL